MLPRRAAARFFDFGVMLIGFTLARSLLGRGDLPAGLLGALALLAGSVTWWVYEAGLVARWGATVGKRLVFVRVASANGATPSAKAAALRALPVLLLSVPFLWPVTAAAWLSVAFAADGRGWPDRIAGTRVLPTPWRSDPSA